jgi:cell division protein FtsQ
MNAPADPSADAGSDPGGGERGSVTGVARSEVAERDGTVLAIPEAEPAEPAPVDADALEGSSDPASPWTPPDVAASEEPQAPRRRVRTRRLVALIAAAALIVAAGLVAATYTSFFAADAIRVRGIQHLTKGEILRASALARGVNVFHLDAADVEARLEREPWVAEATLTKELPRTVVLTIRERVPVAVVNDGSVERLVADDGSLLDIGAPSTLPRIVAGDGATTSDPGAVRAAAGVVAAMRPDVRRQIAFVRLLAGGNLALELRSGVPVAYGSPADAASKAQALAALLRYAERTGERYTSIDVSVPTAPAGVLVGG